MTLSNPFPHTLPRLAKGHFQPPNFLMHHSRLFPVSLLTARPITPTLKYIQNPPPSWLPPWSEPQAPVPWIITTASSLVSGFYSAHSSPDNQKDLLKIWIWSFSFPYFTLSTCLASAWLAPSHLSAPGLNAASLAGPPLTVPAKSSLPSSIILPFLGFLHSIDHNL